MKVGRLDEELSAESLIPGSGLDNAFRRLQLAVHMPVGHRGANRRSIGRKPADRWHVVLREGADGKRRPLRELSEAATKDSTAVRQQADGHSKARRIIDALHHVIAVGAEAELEHQTIVEAPAILNENR